MYLFFEEAGDFKAGTVLKKDGTMLRIKNDGSGAELLKECAVENQIESIHSTEPNLETVFMELTGRGFLV